MAEPTIFRFNAERDAIIDEVVARVASEAGDPLLLLNDAAYNEIRRLEARPGDEKADLARFRDIARHVGKMSVSACRERVRELAAHYARDVAGNFDPRVYKLTSGFLPTGISFLISPLDALTGRGGDALLRDHVVIQGPVDEVRGLVDKGTLIFVPTHLSNFDSIVMGYALDRGGLPPATYGAGKNLFSNKLLSFFMQNLGAYRVDRRIKHQLYKEVLKAYSCVLVERGYHSLFFPGGTRSRSGGVEEKLKLGLMGTGLEAFVRSLQRGKPRRVFFVPVTINYALTLEARTLVDDYLAEVGKSRYIIEDDESTQLERVLTLMRKLVLTEGSVVIRFADPLDPFGNRVTPDGRSVDTRGRSIDPATYVTRDGEPVLDEARDAQYTRELGEAICESYARETVLLSTHIVAGAAFAKLRDAYPRADVFTLLRNRDEVRVSRQALTDAVGELLDRARELEDEGKLALGPGIRKKGAVDLLDEAVRAWSGYHSFPVLRPDADGYVLADTNLLYYYQNRLAVSGLGYHFARGASATSSGGAARAAAGGSR